MTRKKSPTIDLAYWFWTEIKGEEWNFNHPLCKGTMRDAKNLIKPKEGTGVTIEEVKRTIEYVVKDMRKLKGPEWKPTSMSCVSWKARDGQFYFEKANTIPPMPPMYEEIAFQDWQDTYGERIAEKANG